MKQIFLFLLCFVVSLVVGCSAIRIWKPNDPVNTGGGNILSPNGGGIDSGNEVDGYINLGECLVANCGGGNDGPDGGDDNYENFKHLDDRYEADGEIDDNDFKDDALTDFRLGYELNYPVGDGKVYVDLQRDSGKSYYNGTVLVAYEKNLGDRKKEIASHKFHSGYGSDAKYNVWARFKGAKRDPSFHGFFENGSQALILIVNKLDNPLEKTDGRVYDRIEGSGSLWFYSFKGHDERENHRDCYEGGRYINQKNWPNASSKKCWFISVGPFNCQAWESRYKVRTFAALEPDSDSCYKKLADFEHLNITKGFNLEDEEDEKMYIAQ